MPKLKLPVTHVVTVEDKEVGETRVYELCTDTKARWAIRQHVMKALDSAGIAHSPHSADAVGDDEFATYCEATNLFEHGLVFCDPDETGPN